MVSLRNVGETHFIVVCPASVITNWVPGNPNQKLACVSRRFTAPKNGCPSILEEGGRRGSYHL